MINNSDKKALSTVVTTLIIILLVFVAIGIVWVVVKNVVDTGAGQIDVGAKCLSSSVKATSVDCTTNGPANCAVSIKRESGNDAIGGVKLVFTNTTSGESTSTPIDVSGDIATLSTKPLTNINSGVASGPDKVEVVVYFKDSSGVEKLCGTTSSYNF